nr:hypothetical protein [Tanacetum cinerariifolium]
MKGSKKNNETLIAPTPILSVEDKRILVPGQMTYPVASPTLDSARSYVMQGASFTQGIISSIPIGGSISPEGFLPSIMLMVIMVTVVIVVVILIVVIVVIVGVVIIVAIIGVVVVVMIIRVVVVDTMEILEFKTSKNRYGDNKMSDSIGGLVFLVTNVGENRMSSGGVIDLIGDEDPTDEDGDTGVGEKTSMAKRYLVKLSEEFRELFPDVAGK